MPSTTASAPFWACDRTRPARRGDDTVDLGAGTSGEEDEVDHAETFATCDQLVADCVYRSGQRERRVKHGSRVERLFFDCGCRLGGVGVDDCVLNQYLAFGSAAE